MDAAQLTFTPLRISTLVTTGHLGTTIQLDKLFEQMSSMIIPIGHPTEGFLKMEHKANVVGHSARDMLTKRRASKKTFFNQSTIVLRKQRKEVGEGADYKEVNIKLFANGGFQMTGVTSEEFSMDVLRWMIERLNALPVKLSETDLRIAAFNIQLLNTE